MSSESSEQEEVALGVRGNLLYKENRTHLPMKVGSLPCSEGGETSAIIGVAELGGRSIVAVPGAVWNRKIAKRKIDKACLGKTLAVDVVTAAPGDPEAATPEVPLRVWVGVLALGEEASLTFPAGELTYDFAEGLLRLRWSKWRTTALPLPLLQSRAEAARGCSRGWLLSRWGSPT